jgi:hypothetical protein
MKRFSTGLILSAIGLLMCGSLAYAGDEQGPSLKDKPFVEQPITVAAVTPRKWTKVPGKASDIAIGGDKIWVLGTDNVRGGHSIYRFNGMDWDKIPGSAASIAVDSDGVPWVCQDNFDIYQRILNEWQKAPGKGYQVAIGGEEVYIIGTDAKKGGYGIYRWARGAWENIPGAGVTIAADGDGVPWVCNDNNDIYRRLDNKWEKMTGKATHVAIGGDNVWAIGADADKGGFGIYRWARGSWDKNNGSAKRIALSGTQVWVVNKHGDIFRSDL